MRTLSLSLVIACRHSYCDYGGHLDDDGKRAALKLVEIILEKLRGNDGKVLLVTSPSTRAVETAEIIGRRLNVGLRSRGCLEIDKNSGALHMEEILNLVDGHTIVIAVAHCMGPSKIIDAFVRANGGAGFDLREIRKASGLCLTVETGAVEDL